jgi:hypothetical protein
VHLDGPITEIAWPMKDLPRRLIIDPLRLALVKSIKKGKELKE